VVVARQRGAGSNNVFWLGVMDDLVRFTVDDVPVESPQDQVPVGTWVHLCGTYDGKALRIYVGGKEVARRSVSPTFKSTMSGVTLGADINGADPDVGDRFFLGRLDEVGVWSRALDPAEIAQLVR
jgi:hypothetical protein